MYSVYKHTSPNGKVYIGITCQNLSHRWGKGTGYKTNKHFWNAIQKYGWENIKHEILFEGLTKEQAEQKEIELIAFYKSNDFKHGYNRSSGGESGLAGTRNGRLPWNKGLKMNPEFCKKVKEGHKGQTPWNKGIDCVCMKGEYNHKSKRIIAVSKNGLIYEFVNARSAQEKLNLSKNAYKNISACAHGKIKSAYGFVWRFQNV